MSISATLQKNRAHLTRLTTNAMLAALYVVFAVFWTHKEPTIEISISTLPLLLCAALFGPLDAAAVALVGSFIEQLASPYGLSWSTLIWMAPVVLQSLLAGAIFFFLRRRADRRLRVDWKLILVVFVCELVLTALNIAAQYVDGALVGYPVDALHILLPGRLLNGLIRAVLTTLLLHLLIPALYRVLPHTKKQ